MSRTIPLGIGIYGPSEVARLLNLHPTRVRRWINGYTYWLHRVGSNRRAKRPPVIGAGELPAIKRRVAVSFLELMELRVVKALVDLHGIPLQSVRKAAKEARLAFNTPHPFANRNVFVEGRSIFAAISTEHMESDVIELRPGRSRQVTLGEVLTPFLKDLEFDEETQLIEKWWPLGRQRPVVLNPAVEFGAPTIDGSRVRTAVAATMAAVTALEGVAESFMVSVAGIKAAVDFERQFRRAA